jgi:hypothetical protein
MSGWPRHEAIDRWLALYHAVAARNGADADIGRRLPSLVSAAGFHGLRVTATTVLFAEPEAVLNWGGSWAERVTASNLAEQAVEYGFATAADLAEIADGWRAWAHHPEAFFMYVNVEVLAFA